MLTGEAQNLYGNFQNNPMFQSMMNNPELKKFQEQMNSGESDENNAVETAKKNKNVRVEKLDENHKVIPQNKTQERLQKKLAAKQKDAKQKDAKDEKNIVIEGEKKKSVKTDNIKVEKTE